MHIESNGILFQAQLWCTSTLLLYKIVLVLYAVAKKGLESPNDLTEYIAFMNDVIKNNLSKAHAIIK